MNNEIRLRPYQQNVVENINKTAERGIRRQLVVMSTGLGKSYTLVFLVHKKIKEGKKVLILVDQEDLVWQWKDYLLNVDENLQIGIEKAEYRANKNDQVVIATVQTLGRKGVKRIKRFPKDHFDYALCDEAHRSIAETWFRTLEYFGFGKDNFDDDNLLVGTTATPFRTSGESLGILYDDIVANYDLRYAIQQGWLVDFELYDVTTNTDLTGITSQKELDQAVDNEERNEEALKAYLEICPDEKALIYTASVDHAYRLEKLFESEGIPSAVIEANTPKDERKQILEDYKSGKIKVIFNYSTMTTGVDLPETSAIMLLRAVQSKLLIMQILGRGLRPPKSAFVDAFGSAEQRKQSIENSTKSTCKVIDMYDKVGDHNLAHVPSLFGLNNELKTKEPKRFFKEVVEPLEKAQKEKGVDISKIKDLDEIDLIVKNRKVDIQSLKVDPEIRQFTNRRWVSIGEDSYEIMYSEDNKVLIIESDDSKKELLDKKEWKLLEYDSKDGVTKELQTFNSLSGAFKIADEYADKMGYEKQFKEIAPWMKQGVTEKQYNLLMKLYSYKTGYCEFEILDERYDDTGVRKLKYKKTGEEIYRGEASTLINEKFNK